MTKKFLELSKEEQRDILNTIAARSTHFSAAVLEKDLWICWVLERLFSFDDSKEFVFKGGTSLSKVFQLIDRFSEDVDVTIDYRFFTGSKNPFEKGTSKSRIKQISDDLSCKANVYVKTTLCPYLQSCFAQVSRGGMAVNYMEDAVIEVEYPTALESRRKDYVPDRVKIEFGGRNTTEPKKEYQIEPYLKEFVPTLQYPQAKVDVLVPERTFWEKATLIHVENQRKEFRAGKARLVRHWYDLALMARSSIGQEALNQRDLLEDVVKHKSVFFYTASAGYDACLAGKMKLVPADKYLAALENDYEKMKEAGMFFSEPPRFDEITDILEKLERKINSDFRGCND